MNCHQVGKEAEQRVLRLLQTKEVPNWLIGPCWTTSHSDPDDQKGIDLWVGTTAGFIPLQIKSRYSHGGNKSRRRNVYYSKGIGYVVIRTKRLGKAKTDNALFAETIKEVERLFLLRQKSLEKVVECVSVALPQQMIIGPQGENKCCELLKVPAASRHQPTTILRLIQKVALNCLSVLVQPVLHFNLLRKEIMVKFVGQRPYN